MYITSLVSRNAIWSQVLPRVSRSHIDRGQVRRNGLPSSDNCKERVGYFRQHGLWKRRMVETSKALGIAAVNSPRKVRDAIKERC